jgi:hypothetical protein
MIVMHASPPCQAVSRMNTLWPKGKAVDEGVLQHFVMALKIMRSLSVVWTLENPGTASRLWSNDWTKTNLVNTHNLDYCAYGFLMKKNTTFAFSDKQCWRMFTPHLCRGIECPSMTLNPGTPYTSHGVSGGHHQNGGNGRGLVRNHCSWDVIKDARERAVIPEQLCYSVLVASKVRAAEIADELVARIRNKK